MIYDAQYLIDVINADCSCDIDRCVSGSVCCTKEAA